MTITFEIIFMLILLITISMVFAFEWLPIDVSALICLIVLIIAGILTPQQAFSGFSNDVIFVLASLFIMSAALSKSGINRLVAELILKIVKQPRFLTPTLMSVTAMISAFFSNTNATAMLIPVSLQLAKKSNIKSSKLLMPLAFASILGGTCTLIGTSTNLASASLIERLGLTPFSLFEFIIPGVLMVIIGIAYLSLLGDHLIPQREKNSLSQQYQIRHYLSQLHIEKDSPAIDQTLASLKLSQYGITPLAIIRLDKKISVHGNRKLESGDKIVVKGEKENLLQLCDSRKFSVTTDASISDQDISSENTSVAEFILMPQSRLIGKSLTQLNFNKRYQVIVLAIYRRQRPISINIQDTPLRSGDVLLMQGEKKQLNKLAARYSELWVSQTSFEPPLSVQKGLYVLLAMIIALLLTALSILPASVAFLSAVIVLVLTRCFNMQDAYASIEWRLLILIACMSSVGLAMQLSGSAVYLGQYIANSIFPFGVHATLAAFSVLTLLLTQPMSNASAALVVLPIAISTANIIGMDPRPLVVIVTLSASLSFITPLEPANLLVFGVGKYRFIDFVKVGLPLTLIMIALLVVIIPLLWPV